ncbi:Glycosyltransferase involved in cell wall bisynthesis [Caloramator quimbayensis]|uniref:Glycosyltransferase involved in cell wall bisynthesis n=1 Tax=Caloramator quimbayensis TaxID=1147123 RepID=A0A1T4Y3X7_9CLOT|nr:glycosyltransferase family 4 protein [Caloramator quimbayensis]SKA96450.1 Glycosyltransferase involved in cell wall bisynthesis [Caloramator quimbayensis]
MVICFLANASLSHTKKWAQQMAKIGHEVHVISHRDAVIDGANVHYLNYSLKNYFKMRKKVHSLIRKINPDILHAHQANTCGLYAATMKGYDFILSTWGSDILIGPEKSFILRMITKYVIKKASYITSDSYYMSEKIIELGGDRNKVFTFPMGVEDELLNYIHEFRNNNLNFISNRRLEKLYNIDVIIDGFYSALSKNKDINLTIAADGSEMEKLKDKVKEYGIEDKVKFTGRYRPEDIGKLLYTNDVFISIPSSDSTSVSLLEAMCCGLFPIVSNLPANKEWVKDRENGYIVKEINSKEVEESILWCCSNKEKIKKASIVNRKIIEDKALWSNNIKMVEELYEKMIK